MGEHEKPPVTPDVPPGSGDQNTDRVPAPPEGDEPNTDDGPDDGGA